MMREKLWGLMCPLEASETLVVSFSRRMGIGSQSLRYGDVKMGIVKM